MAVKQRPTIRGRKAKVKAKFGLSRKPNLAGPIKGEVIYRNPNAIPVSPSIAARSNRIPFSLANVEWISMQHEIGRGGFGNVFLGRIKFKGVDSSQRVAVKKYRPGLFEKPTKPGMHFLGAVIQRLDQSGVPHPKMAFLQGNDAQYVIMEPFVGRKGNWIATKFLRDHQEKNLFRNLNFRLPSDRLFFRQAIAQVALLAKTGLRLKKEYAYSSHTLLDVFNVINLANGKRKLFVQDIDKLEISDDYFPDNFWHSARWLIQVCSERPGSEFNEPVGEEIAANIAKTFGFS